MSNHMLSDSNTINDFNPFVMGDFNPPGAISNPHSFKHTKKVVDKHSLFDRHEESPICDFGITAGDNTIAICRPAKPNCPMNRLLLPERNFDYDIVPKRHVGGVRGFLDGIESPRIIFLTLSIVVMFIALARR